jgi:hypothetical protein
MIRGQYVTQTTYITSLSLDFKQRELVYALNTLKRKLSYTISFAVFKIMLLKSSNGRFKFVKVLVRLLLVSIRLPTLRSMNLESISNFK